MSRRSYSHHHGTQAEQVAGLYLPDDDAGAPVVVRIPGG
jgi:hypothetical protein